jgi:hypothetical protein
MQKQIIIRQHTQNLGTLFNLVDFSTSFKLIKCTAVVVQFHKVYLCDLHRNGVSVSCTHLSPFEA